MAAMFPSGEGGGGDALTRDGFVTFIAETRKDIQYLAKSIDQLKDTVQEMVDRFEADADDLRKSLGGLSELRNGHVDLGRRMVDIESKAAKLDERVKILETWVVQARTVGAVVGLLGGMAGSLIYFLVGKIWK